MPRPNPPRKRPRRRPDSVERAARAEVSLAKQTAQAKEKNGTQDAKAQSSAKSQSNAKARPASKGGPPPRAGRVIVPFVPWANRSYAILIIALAVAEVLVGSLAFFTLANPKPTFGLYVLGVSYTPLVPVAAALVAAPIAKFISKEARPMRFMESAMAGIMQYFVWLALFVALTYVIGGFATTPASKNSPSSTPLPTSQASPAATAAASPSPTASGSTTATTANTIATPQAVLGLLVIDVLSFVATFYLYPRLYRFMQRRPPPRAPPTKGAKSADDAKPMDKRQRQDAKRPGADASSPDGSSPGPTGMVERLDDAHEQATSEQETIEKDPTP